MMEIKLSLFIFILAIGSIHLQTKLETRSKFQNQDFVFDLAGSQPVTMGKAGAGQQVNVGNLPSLKGEGVSYTLFNIDPCGINLPHVHPRATEIFFVIAGTFQTSFSEENGGRTITNEVSQGKMTFFPQGLIHEEVN